MYNIMGKKKRVNFVYKKFDIHIYDRFRFEEPWHTDNVHFNPTSS